MKKYIYGSYACTFNPLPDDTILALPKLKALADDNFRVAQLEDIFDRIENNVRKGENAGCQYFLLLSGFQKASFHVSSKSSLCGKKLNGTCHTTGVNPLPHNDDF